MLRQWAQHLLEAKAAPQRVALHLADAVAACLAGAGSVEGRALASLVAPGSDAAAYAAAAASIIRLTECDDIHLPSCVTPSAAVMPVALAGATPARRSHAIAAGIRAGLQLGLAIGGGAVLSRGVWPSLVAAPVMAATTAAVLRSDDVDQLAHALALALAGTTARIGRPAGPLPGRWWLFGQAVRHGQQAAAAAAHGVRGDLDLLTPAWLEALTGAPPDMAAFETPVGLNDVGGKPFATARQGATAIAAFQLLLDEGLDPQRIEAVEVAVPTANAGLLQRAATRGDRLASMSNVALQIAIAALAPDRLFDVDRTDLPYDQLANLAAKVTVVADPALDLHLPRHWAGRVTVTAGGTLTRGLVAAAFDANAPELPATLDRKWQRLLPDPHDLAAIRAIAAGGDGGWSLIETHLRRAALSS